jgi:hypothetical protein
MNLHPIGWAPMVDRSKSPRTRPVRAEDLQAMLGSVKEPKVGERRAPRLLPTSMRAELAAAGMAADTMADVRDGEPGVVVPVLIRWFGQLENNADRRLALKVFGARAARPWSCEISDALIRAYQRDEFGDLRWAIADTLTKVPCRESFASLVDLLHHHEFGQAREMLLVAIAGTRDRRAAGSIAPFLNDSDLAGHAVIGMGIVAPLATPYRALVEQLTHDHRAWVRKEATRALEKIDREIG